MIFIWSLFYVKVNIIKYINYFLKIILCQSKQSFNITSVCSHGKFIQEKVLIPMFKWGWPKPTQTQKGWPATPQMAKEVAVTLKIFIFIVFEKKNNDIFYSFLKK